MAEDLQGLLEKIRSEGLNKAQSEREKIVSEAQSEAAEIRRQAQAEADKLRADAEKAAKEFEDRSKQAMKQASRDILLALDTELKNRLIAALTKTVGSAMTASEIAKLINQLSITQSGDIKILLSDKDLSSMRDSIASLLKVSCTTQPEFFADRRLAGGFKVSFGSGDQPFWDFSDVALGELLGGYLTPELSAILKSAD